MNSWKNKKVVSTLILPSMIGALLTGCLVGEQKQFFSTHVVCDGFGNTGGDRLHGLKANLFYFDDIDVTTHGYTGVSDFFRWGHIPDVTFYFSNLYVPTRPFSSGFVMRDGTPVTKANNDPLYEHFAFKFTGGVQLPNGAPTKNYQFAIMSDDGSKLVITRPGATPVVNVNNDGNHPSQFVVGTAPVQVSSTAIVPIELDWYQGPRYHIALVLLWREWKATNFNPNDPWNGQASNNLYFDSTQTPPAPMPAWNDIMTRWEVVPGNVLTINSDINGTEENPCH